MKILILLLISINSYADTRVSVTRNNGRVYGDAFRTESKANAYIADNISNDSWGKVGEYTVTKTDITTSENLRRQKIIDRATDKVSFKELLNGVTPLTDLQIKAILKRLLR